MKYVPPVVIDTKTFSRASTATYTGPDGTLLTAAINEPRFAYTPITLAWRGLLLEASVTNRCLRSQEINVTWTITNITVTANSTVAPDGTTTADTISTNVTAAGISQTMAGITLESTVAFSVYAKVGTTSWLRMLSGTASAWFNLSTGALGTSSAGSGSTVYLSHSIEPAANGFYRCTFVVVTTGITNPNLVMYAATSSGSSSAVGNSIILWGAQAEEGTKATSYIPTVAAAVTRSADSFTGKIISNLVDDALYSTVWSSVTTYALNDKIQYANGMYISLQAANLNHIPTTGQTDAWWQYMGPLNTFAMFDGTVETQSTRATRFEFAIGNIGVNSAFAMLNLAADSVKLCGVNASTGDVVYDVTINLIQDVADCWEWCFSATNRRIDFAVFDVPLYSNLVWSVAVNAGTGNTAAAGVCVIGAYEELGESDYDTQVSIVDYSQVKLDSFGRRQITVRGYARKLNVPITIRSDDVDYALVSLASHRSKAILWVAADQYSSTIVYGLYKDFKTVFKDYEMSRCNLEIEGLV